VKSAPVGSSFCLFVKTPPFAQPRFVRKRTPNLTAIYARSSLLTEKRVWANSCFRTSTASMPVLCREKRVRKRVIAASLILFSLVTPSASQMGFVPGGTE
jgi:hypothetical protein